MLPGPTLTAGDGMRSTRIPAAEEVAVGLARLKEVLSPAATTDAPHGTPSALLLLHDLGRVDRGWQPPGGALPLLIEVARVAVTHV